MGGHSLGGGIAQVVAAQHSIPALVWSAPGVGFSAYRFDVLSELSARSVVIVTPDGDPVPRVDEQLGTVQHIECRNKEGKKEWSVNCHAIKKSACEVWRVCGDKRHRDFRKNCGLYIDERFFNHSNIGLP